jgi:hypothetical protein
MVATGNVRFWNDVDHRFQLLVYCHRGTARSFHPASRCTLGAERLSGRAADRQIVDGRVYFIIVSHYFKLGESRCDPLGFVGPRQTFASLIPAAKQSEIQNKVKFKRCPKSIGIIRFGTALIRGQMPAKNGRNLGAAAKLSGLAASTPGFTNIFLQSGYLKSLRAPVAGPDF